MCLFVQERNKAEAEAEVAGPHNPEVHIIIISSRDPESSVEVERNIV